MCRKPDCNPSFGKDSMKCGAPHKLFPMLLSLFMAGCGYHTAGHAVQGPESVKTIAIPAFTNFSTSYRIEQMLTASVIREFNLRTHYHVIHEASDDADA